VCYLLFILTDGSIADRWAMMPRTFFGSLDGAQAVALGFLGNCSMRFPRQPVPDVVSTASSRRCLDGQFPTPSTTDILVGVPRPSVDSYLVRPCSRASATLVRPCSSESGRSKALPPDYITLRQCVARDQCAISCCYGLISLHFIRATFIRLVI
jgi:hypothetical protein